MIPFVYFVLFVLFVLFVDFLPFLGSSKIDRNERALIIRSTSSFLHVGKTDI